MNLANKISIFRLLLIPVFVGLILIYRNYLGDDRELLRYGALAVFAIASISDGVDGFVARAFNQKTRLGSFLDPLADKLLLVTAIVLLSLNIPGLAKLPVWFPVLALSRDLFITLGALVVHLTTGHLKVLPNLLGKTTTVFQMSTVIWVLLKWPHPEWLWWSAGLLTFLSGIVYIVTGSKQLTSE